MTSAAKGWSECGQIFFCDGKGYGLTDTLQTICLGTEGNIEAFFNGKEADRKYAIEQSQVLMKIQNYRKEEDIGTTDTGTASMERTSDNRPSRRKQRTTGLLATRKRLPLRPPRTKGKSLSR